MAKPGKTNMCFASRQLHFHDIFNQQHKGKYWYFQKKSAYELKKTIKVSYIKINVNYKNIAYQKINKQKRLKMLC